MTKAENIVGKLLEDYGAGDIEPEAGGGPNIHSRFRKSGPKPTLGKMNFVKRGEKPAADAPAGKEEDDEEKE